MTIFDDLPVEMSCTTRIEGGDDLLERMGAADGDGEAARSMSVTSSRRASENASRTADTQLNPGIGGVERHQ